jgi:hypothetical protein
MLEIKITLRIFSNKLAFDEIAKVMKIQADYGFSTGDQYARGRRTRESSLWSIESKLERTASFENHIISMLQFVNDHKEAIDELRASTTMDLFCYMGTQSGQGSAQLSAQTCRLIAQCGLSISLDIHATAEDNE